MERAPREVRAACVEVEEFRENEGGGIGEGWIGGGGA